MDHRTTEAFEEAIFNAPDDVDGYLVYSDWLQSHSDPRGELIALQAEDARVRARPERHAQRAARIAELLSLHGDALLGWQPVWDEVFGADHADILSYHWYCGFVDRLSVQLSEDGFYELPGFVDFDDLDDPGQADSALAPLLDPLLSHPSMRFVRDLRLGICCEEDYAHGVAPLFVDSCNKALVAALVRAGTRPARALALGDFSQREAARGHFGRLSPLWPLYPRLERLIVRGNCELGERIPLLSLRHLELWLHERDFGLEPHFGESGGIGRDERREQMALVLGSFLPELSSLVLEFGTRYHDVSEDLVVLAPLLEGRGFAKLRHLGLRRHYGDDSGVIVELLARAPITRQLETLDLSDNELYDLDVEWLLSQPERFARLRTLDLRHNRLSDAMVEELARLPGVRAIGQRPDGDWM